MLFLWFFTFYLVNDSFANVVEDIIVTATRTKTASDQLASTVHTLNFQPLSEKHQTSLGDVIKNIEGIEILNQGGVGKVSPIFIRGANSEHTLVLIDGIEANDPMSPTRAFDFARLNVNDIERIEVVKGPQSVLYGSNSLGGVINIITKKGRGESKLNLLIEGGSYGSQRTTLGLNGSRKTWSYNFMATQESSDGYSSANKKDGNTENDGHKQHSFTTKINQDLNKRLNLEFVGKYINANTELDENGALNGDDFDYNEDTEQLFSKIKASTYFLSGLVESSINLGYNLTKRQSHSSPFGSDPKFKAQNLKIESINNINITNNQNISLGVSYKKDRGESSAIKNLKASIKSTYLQYQFKKQHFFGTIGARMDEHSQVKDQISTYKATLGSQIKTTKIKTSFGTGFKAPSLSQLYDPTTGNTDLEPEEVKSWEVGFESSFYNKKLKFNSSYFQNHYSNLISFEPIGFRSINIGESKIHGFESSMSLRAIERVILSANFTRFFKFKNGNETLLRRPRNSASAQIQVQWNDQMNTALIHRYIGHRLDFDANTFTKTKMKAYNVTQAITEYEFKKNQSLYVRIDNLFNSNYEEINGFGTAELSVYLGLNLQLK